MGGAGQDIFPRRLHAGSYASGTGHGLGRTPLGSDTAPLEAKMVIRTALLHRVLSWGWKLGLRRGCRWIGSGERAGVFVVEMRSDPSAQGFGVPICRAIVYVASAVNTSGRDLLVRRGGDDRRGVAASD